MGCPGKVVRGSSPNKPVKTVTFRDHVDDGCASTERRLERGQGPVRAATNGPDSVSAACKTAALSTDERCDPVEGILTGAAGPARRHNHIDSAPANTESPPPQPSPVSRSRDRPAEGHVIADRCDKTTTAECSTLPVRAACIRVQSLRHSRFIVLYQPHLNTSGEIQEAQQLLR